MALGRRDKVSWVEFVGLMLAPAAAFWAAGKAWDALARADTWYWRAGRNRPRTMEPAIERIGADLHRLSREIDRIEGSDLPAKMARMQAASLAYDDVLLAACRALEVPQPSVRPPLEPLERLEAEAALARQGLVW